MFGLELADQEGQPNLTAGAIACSLFHPPDRTSESHHSGCCRSRDHLSCLQSQERKRPEFLSITHNSGRVLLVIDGSYAASSQILTL